MPNASVVLWATAVGLIVLMLGIIGRLVDRGFTSVKADMKAEIKTLWEKLDKHQSLGEANASNLQELKARSDERMGSCLERHKIIDERFKVMEQEISGLQHRRDSDR